MPLPNAIQPVIVGERAAEPDRGQPHRAFIGYEVTRPGTAVPFSALAEDPERITMYAVTATGDIWRYHRGGFLSLNGRERYPLEHPDGAFVIGDTTLQLNHLREPVRIEQIVIVTDRSTRLEHALLETGARYNDTVTRYRLKGRQRPALEAAAGPPVVRLGRGLGLEARYGEDIHLLDAPTSPDARGIGTSGQYPYAFVQRRITHTRSGAETLRWSLVTPEDQLPLWVGHREATRTSTSVVEKIYGVIDPLRTRTCSPMSTRVIENSVPESDLQHLSALTRDYQADLKLERATRR